MSSAQVAVFVNDTEPLLLNAASGDATLDFTAAARQVAGSKSDSVSFSLSPRHLQLSYSAGPRPPRLWSFLIISYGLVDLYSYFFPPRVDTPFSLFLVFVLQRRSAAPPASSTQAPTPATCRWATPTASATTISGAPASSPTRTCARPATRTATQSTARPLAWYGCQFRVTQRHGLFVFLAFARLPWLPLVPVFNAVVVRFVLPCPPPSSQPSGNGVAYQVEYHNDGPNTGTYNFAAQFSFDNTYQTFTSTVVNFGETLNIDASFPGESHDI